MGETYQRSAFAHSIPDKAAPDDSTTANVKHYSAQSHVPFQDPGITPIPAHTRPSTQGSPDLYTQKRSPRFVIIDVILRISVSVLSLIALCVMASNSRQGAKFSDVSAYKYVVAISVLGLFYSLLQTLGGFFYVISGSGLLPPKISKYSTFISDQILAYLLLSAASAGASVTVDLQESCDAQGKASFCSQAAGSISVLFIAFAVLLASLIFSWYCDMTARSG